MRLGFDLAPAKFYWEPLVLMKRFYGEDKLEFLASLLKLNFGEVDPNKDCIFLILIFPTPTIGLTWLTRSICFLWIWLDFFILICTRCWFGARPRIYIYIYLVYKFIYIYYIYYILYIYIYIFVNIFIYLSILCSSF